MNLPIPSTPLYHTNSNGQFIDSYGNPLYLMNPADIQRYADQQSQQLVQQLSNELATQNSLLRKSTERENSLSSSLADSQKALQSTRNELNKMKTSSFKKSQFLAYRPHPTAGLYLITYDPNKNTESIQSAGNVWLKAAVKVHSPNGDCYFALKFSRTNITEDLVIFISENIFSSNIKLISELSEHGVTINLDVPISKKADLFRSYLSTVISENAPLIYEEEPLGWNFNNLTYKYTTPNALPWWNRKGILPVTASSKELFFSAVNNLKQLLTGNFPADAKILKLLPYAAEFLPLLEKKGCTGDVNVNIILPNLSPAAISTLNTIMGTSTLVDLPLKETLLKTKLSSITSKVLLFRIKNTELNMANKSLLERNLQMIKSDFLGIKIPVIISTAPLLMNDGGTILIEYDENTKIPYLLGNFSNVESNFHAYLTRNANWIAHKVQLDKIPAEYGELGISFELFFLTQKVLCNFCKEYLGEYTEYTLQWIKDFYAQQILNADTDGLSLRFLDCLQSAVEQKTVTCITPYNKYIEHAVIVTDSEIYFRKNTFKEILSDNIAGYNTRTLLRTLFEDGYLVADISSKVNFTTRRRSTNANNEPYFPKFIVLRKDKIVHAGDFDYFYVANANN